MKKTRILLVASLLGALPTAGCATTRSTAGPFLSDLHVEGTRLRATRCRMDYVYTDLTGFYVFLAILTLPLRSGGGGGGESESRAITRSACRADWNELPGALEMPAARAVGGAP